MRIYSFPNCVEGTEVCEKAGREICRLKPPRCGDEEGKKGFSVLKYVRNITDPQTQTKLRTTEKITNTIGFSFYVKIYVTRLNCLELLSRRLFDYTIKFNLIYSFVVTY